MPTGNSIAKLAVFDFCETLADFQTASAFVDFVRQNHKTVGIVWRNAVYVLMVKSQLIKLMTAIDKHRHSISKHIKLWQLRGVGEEVLEEMAERFYKERVEPHLIGDVVGRMKKLQSEGYTVGLSSGGYGVYLKHFVDKYGLDFCQCSEIELRNGRCTGKMMGNDCMRKEKTVRLNREFGKAPADSVSFSDSESDLPLLQWTAEAVVVSRGTHQKWIEKYNFKELIWQQ